MLNQTLS